MATAYLLASVLTLIVALVHGQEAFPEQENLVVVAEDRLEDELNSFTDLILPGPANIRAECIQRKKCKNKGGTCQKKGNTCPGGFVKGCSKGCSCCLPEEITCKPSKKCKRANGVCISRSECNGNKIDKGCKKPKSCKRTHVCCVQDKSTTEVPTCRGPSCPAPDDCPDQTFTDNYVCTGCKTNEHATAKMNTLGATSKFYTLFADKTYGGTHEISYAPIGDQQCVIDEIVRTWRCTLKSKGWSCTERGFCTAEIKKNGGVYTPDSNSIECPCANPAFEDKHKCSDCTTEESTVLIFVNRHVPRNQMPRTVFVSREDFRYTEVQPITDILCAVVTPTPVIAWKCESNADGTKFVGCEKIGLCSNILSKLTNGHLEFEELQCSTALRSNTTQG